MVVAAAAVLLALAAALWWRFVRPVPVEAVRLTQGEVAVQVIGPGSVQARVPVTVAARLTATVTTLQADVGDRVRAGQVLATLDDRELAARRGAVAGQRATLDRHIEAAEATLRKAEADHALARSRHQRDLALQARGFVSDAGLDGTRAALQAAEAAAQAAVATLAARRAERTSAEHELQAAQAALSHTQLRSPVDGVVVQRLVEPGSTVVPGSALLKLVDPATLWVAVRVDESVLGRVRPGQPARIRLRTGDTATGRVARIARQSDAATREIEVHVSFDTVPERFAIDQEAEVRIDTGSLRGLRLPAAALLRDREGRAGVLVVVEGRARFVPVRAGATDGEQLLVEGELAAGALVVVPSDGVRDGMRVAPRGDV